MVVESWAGKTPDPIAAQLHCHPQTIRMHVAHFTQQDTSQWIQLYMDLTMDECIETIRDDPYFSP